MSSTSEARAGQRPAAGGRRAIEVIAAGIAKRRAAERRFQRYGQIAIGAGIACVAILFISIFANAYTAFWQTHIRLEITLDAAAIDPDGRRDSGTIWQADYRDPIRAALREMFPQVSDRRERLALYGLISNAAPFDLRDRVVANPALIGTTFRVWLPADDDVDMLVKRRLDRTVPQTDRRLKDNQLRWLDAMAAAGRLERRFNADFFTRSDSRDPEIAGIWGAVVGSLYTLGVTLALSFPLGVAAAIYLEEFAPRNRWTDLIEVNINNLAAVPSIVFGLLGLAVFINFFGLPRSAPIVGGLVLTLMTLPTIIIASRAALTAVPPSIREAALGIGASPMQTVLYHVLPLAMPGMLTGAIIGMAQALGETAPLLMIGMVAFIADVPRSVFDPATALPVQIFLWADSPERAYVERTSAAIVVLLAFLGVMNAAAVVLRRRFEHRW